MNTIIRLILLFMIFLTSQSGMATTSEFAEHQYDVNHIVLSDEIYGYDTNSNPRDCCQTPFAVNTQDRSFLAFVDDFLATKSGTKLLASPRKQLLDSTTDLKLRNRIDQMYRPNAKVGSGSTADAIRHELRTGELLSKKGHFQKGIEMRNGLTKDLNSGRLNAKDSATARHLRKDLQNALTGN